jgi:hypothetical protein
MDSPFTLMRKVAAGFRTSSSFRSIPRSMWSSAGDGNPASTEAETRGSFRLKRLAEGMGVERDISEVEVF